MRSSILKSICLVFFIAFISLSTKAQVIDPPQWNIEISDKNLMVGDTVDLQFEAKIPEDWYIYSNDFDPDLGPMLTVLTLEEQGGVKPIGKLIPVDPKRKFDDIWQGEVSYFVGTGLFKQKMKITGTAVKISGSVSYQMCSDVSGKCVR